MKSKSQVRPYEDFPTIPRDYVPRAYREEDVQRAALQLTEAELAPDLEALKESDPDSYRMVVYSWA